MQRSIRGKNIVRYLRGSQNRLTSEMEGGAGRRQWRLLIRMTETRLFFDGQSRQKYRDGLLLLSS